MAKFYVRRSAPLTYRRLAGALAPRQGVKPGFHALPYFKSLFKKEVRNSRGDKPVASLNTLQKYLGESNPAK